MNYDIIILTYNSKHLISGLLQNISHDNVIFIDNASTDGTDAHIAQNYPHIRLIRNDINVGFGRALNQAIASSDKDYILTLNPDIHISQDNIDQLADIATSISEKDWLLIAPKTGVEPEVNSAQETGGIRKVNWVSGAVMFFNRKIFDALQGFDPSFFLFFEETDLQKRAQSAGYHMYYAPNISVPHDIGSSSLPSDFVTTLKSWHVRWSECYYAKKHGLYKLLFSNLLKAILWPIKKHLKKRDPDIILKRNAMHAGRCAFFLGKKAFIEQGTKPYIPKEK